MITKLIGVLLCGLSGLIAFLIAYAFAYAVDYISQLQKGEEKPNET